MPAVDYSIVFKATNTVGTTTNRSSVSVAPSLPILIERNTVNSKTFVITNTLITVTNFFIETFDGITNSLPRHELQSSSTNDSSVATFFITNGITPQTFSTNLPSRKIAFTNGTPPEVLSPSFTIWNPTRQAPLPFETGSSVTTNALLSSLTNGCVFTATSALNNSYCFVKISQTIDSDVPTFNAVEHNLPQTNLTVVTATTNYTDGAAQTRTITNTWSLVTYSGPTNLLFSTYPFVEYRPALIITSNRLTEVFRDTYTNTLALSRTLVTTNTVVKEGSNYVTYAYDRSSYRLNYRIWEPGEVGFSATNVQVSESSASVSLTVTRKGGTAGELRLRYGFEDADTPGRDYEAQNGHDYKAVEGELFWADGKSGSTNIVVSLIQDLRPTWEGNERFAVVLRKHEGATIQALLNASSNAVVTLQESAKINAGTFGFSGTGAGAAEPFPNAAKPAATVTEGDALTLWVERAGGSNGLARVRVTAVNGTAKSPADFDALSETLEWADGETGAKPVTLQTVLRDPFNRDAALTIKLAAVLNAPLLSAASSVAVTLRDLYAARSLADTAEAAARHGATFKAVAGYWFWPDAATLRCESPVRTGASTLSLTLTGPGVLTFDWGITGWESPDKLVCAGGIVTAKTLTDGATASTSVFVKAGKQTVTWTFTKASAIDTSIDAFASVANIVWHPMTRATEPEPANQARAYDPAFSWTLPDASAVNLGGDFGIDELNVLPQTTTVTAVSPSGFSSSGVTSASFEDLWGSGVSPSAGRSYMWRVDTVFESEDGRFVYTGLPWTFTALNPDTSSDTDFPPDGAVSPGAYEARQGVFCDLGEISPSADGTTYALVSGTLPAGLSLAKTTGRIFGVPTKAGTWAFLLQATAPGRIPYATAALTITVYPLGSFAGTYDGWPMTNTPPDYCGTASLTVSETGAWTAKLAINGTAYSFVKAGLTAESASDPATVNGLAFGASFVATDGKYTNALEIAIDPNGSVSGELTLYTLVKAGTTNVAVAAEYAVELYRNNWSEGHMLPVLGAYKGYYTVSLPVTAANNPDNTPWGSGYATLTVGDKGSVKLTGALADGQTWSSSTTLLMPDTNDTSAATVYVYAQPSAYAKNGALTGFLRIKRAESVYGNTVDSPDSDPLQWRNTTPTSVYGATGSTVSDTTGFRNWLTPAGGFYDTVMNLQTYYLCKALRFADSTGFPGTDLLDRLPSDNDGKSGISGYLLLSDETMLPFGTNIVVGAQSLSVGARHLVTNDLSQTSNSMLDYIDVDESSNVAGLTLSLTRATGLFSGSFDLVYERENVNNSFVRRTRKVAHKGVHTPVRPDRTADDPSLGVQGAGFYLIPDTGSYLDNTGRTKTYAFSWSFAFELLSEEVHDTSWCDGTHE